MTMVTVPPPASIPPPSRAVRKFSVDEYDRLVEQGFFSPDDRCELLEGFIVQKMPRHPLHEASVARTNRLLTDCLPQGWHIRVQGSVSTGESVPEPDLAVVLGDEFDYAARHPTSADVAMLVEVANTSLLDDREWKARIYARAGMAVYWIVNLADSRVEVYTDPTGLDPAPAYRRRDDYAIGQTVPVVIRSANCGTIPVRSLIP